MNCAAIPHELLENQLFGHVRGAYTGASGDQEGLFVAASRGTVFLDEIGELARSTQAKLLRAIENREVLPVGATRPVSFQARIVTATNKDLAAEVAADRFRADLYYRLNVVCIHLPPLGDRREDIPSLVAMLIAKHATSLGKRIDGVDNRAIRGLMTAAWPGNVRELDNALERAVLFSEGPILTPDDFPPGLISPGDTEDPGDDLRTAVRKSRAPAHRASPARVRQRQARSRQAPRPGSVFTLPQAGRTWSIRTGARVVYRDRGRQTLGEDGKPTASASQCDRRGRSDLRSRPAIIRRTPPSHPIHHADRSHRGTRASSSSVRELAPRAPAAPNQT